MIHIREMIHGQWYMGNHQKTAVAQWHADKQLFVYGAPQEQVKKEGAHALLNPQPALPPIYEYVPHPMLSTTETQDQAFTPVAPISGPTGPWTPKQSMDLSNNINALRKIRNQ